MRVFISYAWENDEYRHLVKRLAERLREDRVDARLDAWVPEGLTIPEFISREIRHADKILVLCSPQYRQKVHAMEEGERITGTGWESMLVTSSIWANLSDRSKIIPVLLRGAWKEAAPDVLIGLRYFDLSNTAKSEANYHELLRSLTGQTEPIPPLGQVPESSGTSLRNVAVDLSHGQAEWRYFATAIDRLAPSHNKIVTGFFENSELNETVSPLILAPPYHQQLARAEIDRLENWVEQGGSLLLMGYYAERHHANNLTELVWRFDFEFGDDLILSQGRAADARFHVFRHDPTLALRFIPESTGHPILADVHEIAFLSSAGIYKTDTRIPECILQSPDTALRMLPKGHIQPDGSRPAIDDWVVDRHGAVPLLVADHWGKGKIALIGTWKIVTVDYGDNAKLFRNILNWLADR
jgi:hypothetical protein